ncbi:PREDICTED: regulator of nonsense transcripts 3B isoform X1 [Papilio polytes]|uniref:regulator of nonsense transcripts 3B isoform X1 n=1 Tax=Papilio polytes TaxID=76194 RepID=UPI00067609D4|nr:PREDICTED: regulator of nonsense transcripts 3B isoform X1 [Papilio polytes]
MTEDQDAKDSQSDSGSKTFVNKNRETKKAKTQRPLTKIIFRRLPPTMTEEAFLDQVSPIPDHDYFYFAKPDPSLGSNVYSRAYINFVNVDDIYLFRDKFDGYIFVDEKGLEYVGIVEYAPFQRIPKKKKKKDPKCGTIESDPIYQDFIENLSKEPETENQPKLEYSYPVNDGNDKKAQSTPLLEYLAARKQDKRGRDERRRRENDKRKMRVERKTKDGTIKQAGDNSEDDIYNDYYDCYDHKFEQHNYWYGEQKVYRKTKVKSVPLSDVKGSHGSDEFLSTDSDWDSHFPALTMKSHNTFTLTSGKYCDKKENQGGIPNSGGDTYFKEDEVVDNDIKKIKSREWEKEKSVTESKDDDVKETRDGTVFESRTFREQRKLISTTLGDKKKKMDGDKKEYAPKDEDMTEDYDKNFKKDKKDKFKESPREQKSKKYSDTRKERLGKTEFAKTDKQAVISKMLLSENKSKTHNYDDIKPFTQLPQVKTDDLTRIIEGMDRKVKLDDSNDNKKDANDNTESISVIKQRRNSLDSNDIPMKEESTLKRQKSLDDRSKSTDREESEEVDKGDNTERRAERRIRNKDRPSLVIYQPGMGKFSKQRLAKEIQPNTTKSLTDSEKKDT